MTNETENERQTSRFDYTVEQTPLHLPNGGATRYFANVRTDTSEVLGIVTERYEVLQNADFFNPVEELFQQEGFGNFKRKTVCTHGGARVRAVYDFADHGIKVGGEDLMLRLKVQNSFDGSLRASFQVGMVRLVCTNGLAVPVAAVGMTRKHTKALDTDLVRDAFHRSVKAFSDAAPAFERLQETSVSQSEGNSILLGFEKSKVMSERMRERVQSVWESPRYHEDRTRNLWNLYNAVTQHLTHDVEDKRFELAERVNTGVLNSLVKAVKAGDPVARLTAVLN
jgi:hypothetical protein